MAISSVKAQRIAQANNVHHPSFPGRLQRRSAEVVVVDRTPTAPEDLAKHATPASKKTTKTKTTSDQPPPNTTTTHAEDSDDDHHDDDALLAAIHRFNADYLATHGEWPASGTGTCPVCNHDKCFGAPPGSDEKWFCFSSNHVADAAGGVEVGRPSAASSGWFGDPLDIVMYENGWTGKKSRADVLSSMPVPGGTPGQTYLRLPSQQLAYVKTSEKYYMRRPDGSWNLQAPIGKETAKKHLQDLGYTQGQAKRVLARAEHVTVYGVDCCPGGPETLHLDGLKYLNAWVRPALVPRPAPYPRVEAVLRNVTNYEDGAYRWLFNWLAFKVQNPGTHTATSVVLTGEEGTGKGLVGRFMRLVLGPENCASVDQNDLESRFNAHVVTKLFIVADEVISKDHLREASSLLKKYTGDDQLYAEAKNANRIPVKNRTSWLFTSNDPVPVRVEGKGDRRYSVFAQVARPTEAYKVLTNGMFVEGSNEFNQEALVEVAGFAHDLLMHPVDSSMAWTPYENQARADLQEAGLTTVEAFAKEVDEKGLAALLDEYPSQLLESPAGWAQETEVFRLYSAEGVRCDALYALYRLWCARNASVHPLANNKFGTHLKRFRPSWERCRASTGKPRPWLYTGVPVEGAELGAPKADAVVVPLHPLREAAPGPGSRTAVAG